MALKISISSLIYKALILEEIGTTAICEYLSMSFMKLLAVQYTLFLNIFSNKSKNFLDVVESQRPSDR